MSRNHCRKLPCGSFVRIDLKTSSAMSSKFVVWDSLFHYFRHLHKSHWFTLKFKRNEILRHTHKIWNLMKKPFNYILLIKCTVEYERLRDFILFLSFCSFWKGKILSYWSVKVLNTSEVGYSSSKICLKFMLLN